ncbi:MAG: hypothetical protein ACLT29_02175 [Ruminococcus callidus]
MLFRAKIALRSVCDITPQLLEKLGVCGLLLDIDNTLTTHDNPVPAAGVEAWVAGMQAAGISLCLVSNNHPPRSHHSQSGWGWTSSARGKSR